MRRRLVSTRKIWTPVLHLELEDPWLGQTRPGAPLQWEQCWGLAVRPKERQRKSDTDTRVDPKTSPVPRLEGNPPAVPGGLSCLSRRARKARRPAGSHTPQPPPTTGPNLAQSRTPLPRRAAPRAGGPGAAPAEGQTSPRGAIFFKHVQSGFIPERYRTMRRWSLPHEPTPVP